MSGLLAPSRRRHDPRGLAFVELIVAMALSLVLAGAIGLVVGPMRTAFETRLEANDMEQRLRAASDSLLADLVTAGAGAYAGAMTGPLVDYLPPVLPFALDAGAGAAGADTITTLSVPSTAAQAVLALPFPAASGAAAVAIEPGCPVGDAGCGFRAGQRVLLFDGSGRFDIFTVRGVRGGTLDLNHELPDRFDVYPAGSKIVAVVVRTYRVDPADQIDGPRLVRDDGSGSVQPVVDHVVALRVEYQGTSRPPELRRPPDDPVGPWTTYGMKPPPAGSAVGTWPPGENCLFAIDPGSGRAVPRAGPPEVGTDDAALVPLPPAVFNDGPWCPDPGAARRFDADLLRIRRIIVTVRVESANDALRGPAGVQFVRAGTGGPGAARLPDREIRLVVAPRNLTAGR